MNIFITGSAGFIGFHLAKKLLERGDNIVGIDNFNNYYDPKLKEDRNKILEKNDNYKLYRGDLADNDLVKKIFKENKIDIVCNLAAQAGVRYSIENPSVYIQTNLVGFANLIEQVQKNKIQNFIYASSSSVYGKNKKTPFSVTDRVDNPVSLYAATKKADELIAHAYYDLYKFDNCIGLRFFTVYGPFGRPDMAYFSFTEKLMAAETIKIFNHGKMKRDFTYIDDITDGVIAIFDKIQDKKFGYKIFNLGNNKPVELMHFVESLENALGKKFTKEYLPMQKGDVPITYANIDESIKEFGFEPKITIEEGLAKFVEWYRDYYKK